MLKNFRKLSFWLSLLGFISIFQSHAIACEWAWKSDDMPDIKSTSASIRNSSGNIHKCKLDYIFLLEPSFILKCGNGDKIELGRSPICSYDSFPDCDYALLTRNNGSQFKMKEQLLDSWDKPTCSGGIATSNFNYILSQKSFSIAVDIQIKVKQK